MDDLVSITTQNIHKIVFKTASVCFKLWTNFEPGEGVLSSYNFNTTVFISKQNSNFDQALRQKLMKSDEEHCVRGIDK